MRRNIRHIMIAVVAFSVLCISAWAHASNVVLTEENVPRYADTYPEVWRLTQQLEEIGKLPDSDDRTKKTLEITTKREEIVKEKGWTDFWEYMDTMGRITNALVPLMVLEKFRNSPKDKRKQASDTVYVQLKERNYSDDEIKTLVKYFPRLKKMLDDAKSIPGKR